MPDFLVDPSPLVPSALSAGLPGLSDDQCLALLARAVKQPDSARLDDVAALMGRLAVPLE